MQLGFHHWILGSSRGTLIPCVVFPSRVPFSILLVQNFMCLPLCVCVRLCLCFVCVSLARSKVAWIHHFTLPAWRSSWPWRRGGGGGERRPTQLDSIDTILQYFNCFGSLRHCEIDKSSAEIYNRLWLASLLLSTHSYINFNSWCYKLKRDMHTLHTRGAELQSGGRGYPRGRP